MKVSKALAAGIVVGVFATTSDNTHAQYGTGIIDAAGTQLVLDGKPFQPVGYNSYKLTSLTSAERSDAYFCGNPLNQTSLSQLLDQMNALKAGGATLVRTWFFQGFAQGTLPPESAPNHIDKTSGTNPYWQAFNRILLAAQQKGMKVIPVLANDQADCEPQGTNKRFEFYSGGYKDQRTTTPYALSYKDYVREVVQYYSLPRPYKPIGSTETYIIEPSTIAWWQLMNEASADDTFGNCPNQDVAAGALSSFASDMTSVIRGISGHLVSLGTIGNGQCGESSARYQTIHSAVDLCEFHDYDNASRSDDNSNNPLPGDVYNGLQVRLSQCAELGKPIFIGEAGINATLAPKDEPSQSQSLDLVTRARYFDGKLAKQVGEKGVASYLLWQKSLEGSDSTDSGGNTFGVGPMDPTEKVTRSWSGRYGKVLADWEADIGAVTPSTQQSSGPRGWSATGGIVLAAPVPSSTELLQSYTRFGALKLTASGGNVEGDAYLQSGTGADSPRLSRINAGDVVTFRIYRPTNTSVSSARAFVVVNGTRQYGSWVSLKADWWNVVMIKTPGAVQGAGVNVKFTGTTSTTCERYEYDPVDCEYYCESYRQSSPSNHLLYLDTVSHDEPSQLEFMAATASVKEGESVKLMVSRKRSSIGSIGATCTASSTGVSSPAQSSDYAVSNVPLVWSDGDYMPKWCTLTAHADGESEGAENVRVALNPGFGSVAGASTQMLVAIGNPTSGGSSPPDDPPYEDTCDRYPLKYRYQCYQRAVPIPLGAAESVQFNLPDPDVMADGALLTVSDTTTSVSAEDPVPTVLNMRRDCRIQYPQSLVPDPENGVTPEEYVCGPGSPLYPNQACTVSLQCVYGGTLGNLCPNPDDLKGYLQQVVDELRRLGLDTD